MADLDGVVRVADRDADQRLLDRPALAGLGARPDVPGGRRNDLVVLDLTILAPRSSGIARRGSPRSRPSRARPARSALCTIRR